MNPIRTGLWLVVLAGFAAGGSTMAAEAAPATTSSTSQSSMTTRFKQVHERVTTLFQHRNEPPAPVEPRHNPFRTPGAAPIAPPSIEGDGASRPLVGSDYSGLAPGSSLALLQQGAATMKVSGIFEIGGRAHLVINSRPYKEGDVVQTLVQGETVYLRVKEISKRSVTLSLNDAEMTLKF